MPTVLVTGANRGLGLGLVRAYLDDGWRVVAASRSASPELDALAGERLEPWTGDLTDDAALDELAGRFGDRPLDVLINNAARMATPGADPEARGVQGFGHFDRALWHEVFDINLFTPMALCERLADAVARADRGRMVTLSSMLGSMGLNDSGGLYAYRSSKAAVNAIMKTMAVDLAARGIIAIAMHPGWVRTDMGGPGADIDIETSTRGMKRVIDGLQTADSGRFLSWKGKDLPF